MAFAGLPTASVVRRALAAAALVVLAGARLAWHFGSVATLAAPVLALVLVLVAEAHAASSTSRRSLRRSSRKSSDRTKAWALLGPNRQQPYSAVALESQPRAFLASR